MIKRISLLVELILISVILILTGVQDVMGFPGYSNTTESTIEVSVTVIPTPTPDIPTSELTITSDTSSVQVGVSKGVTFYVERPGTVTCMSTDCPEPEPAMTIGGAYVNLEGAATGSGTTNDNGNVVIYINANNAGTIYVTVSKSGYTDGSTTIIAESVTTPIPPTPDIPVISVTFDSDKIMYIRGELVYLTITNKGEDAINLSESNKVNWKIVSEVYESGTSAAIGDITTDTENAVAMSETYVQNTKLFPGNPLTVPWDQRDRDRNLAGQGRYKGCVIWSYNGEYHESCTDIFEIVVPVTPQVSPLPCPTIDTPYCEGTISYQGKDANGCDLPPNCIITPAKTKTIPRTTDRIPIGPTINLRPVDDDITLADSGLIELYMDNPSVNDEVMYADVRITVPSGINVYGQGFGDAGAAGVLHGTFELAPGKVRTIQISIKPEKTGNFLITFSGTYWSGEHKDDYRPISLTNTVEVSDPILDTVSPPQATPAIRGFDIIFGIGILMVSYILMRK